MQPWDFIVVHHSLTKDGQTVSWDAIRRFHMTPAAQGGMGMREIGYHFGVELVGTHVEVLRGRPLRMEGAHTKEAAMNRRGIGVCMIGNFDLETPSDSEWLAAVSIVADLQGAFRIPRANVIGHREAGLLAGFDWRKGQFKTCPGSKFDMEAFRAAVAP